MFDLTEVDVARLNPNRPEDRDRLRLLAIGKGWIRVRFHRDTRVLELLELDARALRSVVGFLDDLNAHDVETIHLREHRPGRGLSPGPVQDTTI